MEAFSLLLAASLSSLRLSSANLTSLMFCFCLITKLSRPSASPASADVGTRESNGVQGERTSNCSKGVRLEGSARSGRVRSIQISSEAYPSHRSGHELYNSVSNSISQQPGVSAVPRSLG